METHDVPFSVRRARLEDAPALAWHRARMFQDMGMVSPGTFDVLQNDARLCLRWARAERLDQLVLHASDEAQRLYERMGFVATNEMRFEGRLEVAQS